MNIPKIEIPEKGWADRTIKSVIFGNPQGDFIPTPFEHQAQADLEAEKARQASEQNK